MGFEPALRSKGNQRSTTTAIIAGQYLSQIKGILKERLWRFRELIYYFRATQYAIWCRLENHEDLSNQSTFVLKLLSSAAVKYWLYWVSISARGCKQNLKNETKQSGLKSDYALSQTRSGALLLKLLIRWRESNRFHKLCTSSVSGLSRSVEESKYPLYRVILWRHSYIERVLPESVFQNIV